MLKMKDEFLALELTKIFCLDNKNSSYNTKGYLDIYSSFLKGLEQSRSETIIGELKELFREYHQKRAYSDFDRIELIENIESVLKNA